jgi:hypothetical protein
MGYKRENRGRGGRHDVHDWKDWRNDVLHARSVMKGRFGLWHLSSVECGVSAACYHPTALWFCIVWTPHQDFSSVY